jgi:hypothetical protein
MSLIKNFLTLSLSNKDHLKKYPLVSICLIEQYLRIYGDDITVNSLKGQILVPQMKKAFIQYSVVERKKMLEASLPLIVYNCFYQDDMPNRDMILFLLDELEAGLQSNKNNQWIKIHYDAYMKNKHINKDYLLMVQSNITDKLEVDRIVFEEVCGKKVDIIAAVIAENSKDYLDWIEAKAKSIQSKYG